MDGALSISDLGHRRAAGVTHLGDHAHSRLNCRCGYYAHLSGSTGDYCAAVAGRRPPKGRQTGAGKIGKGAGYLAPEPRRSTSPEPPRDGAGARRLGTTGAGGGGVNHLDAALLSPPVATPSFWHSAPDDCGRTARLP